MYGAPLLFTLYTADIGRIIRAHNLLHHCYANDMQLYFFCTPQESACLNLSDVELTYHAPSVECAVPVYRHTTSKGLTFIKKNENDEFTIFLHFYVYLMAS